jgi:hypothetical protein
MGNSVQGSIESVIVCHFEYKKYLDLCTYVVNVYFCRLVYSNIMGIGKMFVSCSSLH